MLCLRNLISGINGRIGTGRNNDSPSSSLHWSGPATDQRGRPVQAAGAEKNPNLPKQNNPSSVAKTVIFCVSCAVAKTRREGHWYFFNILYTSECVRICFVAFFAYETFIKPTNLLLHIHAVQKKTRIPGNLFQKFLKCKQNKSDPAECRPCVQPCRSTWLSALSADATPAGPLLIKSRKSRWMFQEHWASLGDAPRTATKDATITNPSKIAFQT